MPRVLHVAPGEVVVEVVVEIESLFHLLRIVVGEFDAGLLPPEQVRHQADESGCANSCACRRMVSLTPQISMMAIMAPAGVREGNATCAPISPSRSGTRTSFVRIIS